MTSTTTLDKTVGILQQRHWHHHHCSFLLLLLQQLPLFLLLLLFNNNNIGVVAAAASSQQQQQSPSSSSSLLASLRTYRDQAQKERRIQQQQKQQIGGLEHDPNLQYQCRGALGEFAACLCNDDAQEVACINAQFVDTAIFQYVLGHYDSIEQLTFHGNNFQDLPDASLFGPRTRLDRLRVLNISANYIVNLHRNALAGCPNIEVLDMSNNEIVLTEENIQFLSHTPRLRRLYLRRAFTTPLNRSGQFTLMMRMFETAQLRRLEFLDLSYNYFDTVPLNLPCPFPSLRHLDLRQNILGSLTLNSTCLAHVGSINLERNYFHALSAEFRAFGDELAVRNPLVQLQLRNTFFCDCTSAEWIQWIREHSAMIEDYRSLSCSRASPARFSGTRLSEVPTALLDCRADLYASSSSNGAGSKETSKSSQFLFLLLLLFFLNYLPLVSFAIPIPNAICCC